MSMSTAALCNTHILLVVAGTLYQGYIVSKGVDQNFTTFLYQHADLEGYQPLIM